MDFIKIIRLVFGILFLPLFLFAQKKITPSGAIEKNNSYAIILGVSNYPNLPKLNYADKDALLFKEFLMSNAGGSMPEEHIKILLNEKATTSGFWIEGISWLQSQKLKKGDKVYLYLAGHGDAINAFEYFFLTYDCQPGNDKNNYIITGNIQLYNLKTRIKEMTSSEIEVFLIMDACRDGDLLPGGKEGLALFPQCIAEQKAGELLMLSAGPGQVSYENRDFGGGHGLFTYFLIKGLSGEADENNDGKILYVELQDYVKKKVRIKSQEKFETIQIPTFCCSEHDLQAVSTRDSNFYQMVSMLDKIGDIYEGSWATRESRNVNNFKDTNGYYIYNQLLSAISNEHLKGENNAQLLFEKLKKNCKDCEVTIAGKRKLAITYLDFGQAKINLYVEGKDDPNSLSYLKKELQNKAGSIEMNNEIIRQIQVVERLQESSFDDAELWMKKAFELLNNDKETENIYRGKLAFLNLYNQRKLVSSEQKESWENKVKQALQADSSAYMFNLAGIIYENLNLQQKAIAYFKKATQKASKWAYPYNNIGRVYQKLNNNKDAEKWFGQAIKQDSNYVNAYINLGIIAQQNNDYSKAENYYLKAINKDSTKIFSINNLASLYAQQNKFTEAEKWYKTAIRANPEYISPYIGLGIINSENKKYEEAEKWYLKALDIDQNSINAQSGLAGIYEQINKWQEAENTYLKISVSTPLFYNNLKQLAAKQRDYNKAKHYALLLLNKATDGNSSNNQSSVGWYYFITGNTDSAQFYYKLAEQSDKSNVYNLFNLLNLYLSKNDWVNAKEYLEKANQILSKKSELKTYFEPVTSLSKYIISKSTEDKEHLKSVVELIKNDKSNSSTASEKDFKISLLELYLNANTALNFQKITKMIEDKKIDYPFVMDYKQFLVNNIIGTNNKLENALKKTFQYWYD